MTPPAPTEEDARAMHQLAAQFTTIRTRLETSRRTTIGLPTLTNFSHQLRSLARLVGDLSDEVLYRATERTSPTAQDRRAIGVLSSATAPAARALEHYAEAYVQLGLVYEFAAHPTNGDLTDMRRAASAVSHDRLDQATTELHEATAILHREVNRADTLPTRTTAAALSRTTTPNTPVSSSPAVPAPPTPPADHETHRHR